MGVLVALAWSWVGGWSMVQLRRLNAAWASARHEAVASGSRRTVVGLQLFGMTADLLRGVLMTAIGCALFIPLSRFVLQRWSFSDTASIAFVVALAGIVAAGAVHKAFHATPGARWLLAAGLAIGAALLGVIR